MARVDVLETLKKLPPRAFIKNGNDDGERMVPQTDAPVIAVTRGVLGFHPIYTTLSADELNADEGVTPAQRQAMFYGSIFGFHVRAADPDSYDERGELKPLQSPQE